MSRYIEEKAFIKEVAKIDLRRLSTKTIGEALDRTPTADVAEVRRGAWVKKDVTEMLYGDIPYESKKAPHCSVCNYMSFIRYRYCPECGAKMDGEGKDDEQK